ncbi:MAG: asparagine synthase (glutamine-hydrolyzing) [Saprospiraceae bacterium]|nr:asparagine synthase (glutamine-hydrolyzing) [Saprospiraceae bacterium]
MCGICGIINASANHPVHQRELETMAKAIVHRGPDDEGFYLQSNVGFGFRRLSIIDVHNGHQPMSNEDGTIWIIFNGEIYNFQELRRDLIQRGHIFKTNTDTETIVHLYEDLGFDCVSKLRGMFAFAIWDQKKQTLFCARDRFGIKPFFYHSTGDRFIFGSEIKNILSIIPSPTIDLEVLDYYVTYGYTPTTKSMYTGILKVPPGHTLTLKPGKAPIISKYWDIQFEPDYSISEQEWIERIDHKLRESVKLRLISDVPLGAFLSGGIDSGSVVALMAQLMNQPVKTFSIGFAEEEFNELPQAKIVADRYQTQHHEQIVEPQSIDILPMLVSSYDEPFADSSAIPTYYVSKFARQHVTVALSGDGGDELFGGYDHHKKLSRVHNFHKMTGGLFITPMHLIHQLIPLSVKGSGISYYMSRPRETFAAYFGKWQETERESAYLPQIFQQLNGNKGEAVKTAILRASNAKDFLSRIQELDMRTWMVDDILTKVDRASMINSLEVRVPILDHEFAELTFQIPPEYKLRNNIGKYIFKKAMQPHLPNEILWQKKKGFGVPLKKWFKDDLKEYLADNIASNNSPLAAYFKPEFVRKLIKDHDTGMRDLNHKIWTLVFLNEWLVQQKEPVKTV